MLYEEFGGWRYVCHVSASQCTRVANGICAWPIAQAMADQVARDEADLRANCLAKWFAQYLDERRLR